MMKTSPPVARWSSPQHREVDLAVTRTGVRFSEPSQKNLRSAVGGTIGMMASAAKATSADTTSMTIYDQIATLLVRTSAASSS